MRRRHYLLLLLLLLLLYPSLIDGLAKFQHYDVSPNSRFGNTFPNGTYILKEKPRDELARMLRELVAVLDSLKIVHILTAGSLLGHRRHNKGIIPFDDDIDLLVQPLSSLDVESIQRLLPDGLKLIYFGGWFKIISDTIGFQDRLSISIDLFEYVVEGETVTLKDKGARKKWPKETWPYTDVFPLVQSTFCGVPVFLPNQVDNVLFQSYGEDCLKVAYVNNVHGAFAFLATRYSLRSKPKKIEITASRKVCA